MEVDIITCELLASNLLGKGRLVSCSNLLLFVENMNEDVNLELLL